MIFIFFLLTPEYSLSKHLSIPFTVIVKFHPCYVILWPLKKVDKLSVDELDEMAQNMFGNLVKAVVDIEKMLICC